MEQAGGPDYSAQRVRAFLEAAREQRGTSQSHALARAGNVFLDEEDLQGVLDMLDAAHRHAAEAELRVHQLSCSWCGRYPLIVVDEEGP